MSDRETLRQFQETHAEFLKNFRRDDTNFLLKPVGDAKNPMLESRKQHQKAAATVDTPLRSLKELRDLCQMPPPQLGEGSYDVALVESVKKALALAQEGSGLYKVLENESWNGAEFTGQVDRKRLAESLQLLIDSQ